MITCDYCGAAGAALQLNGEALCPPCLSRDAWSLWDGPARLVLVLLCLCLTSCGSLWLAAYRHEGARGVVPGRARYMNDKGEEIPAPR